MHFPCLPGKLPGIIQIAKENYRELGSYLYLWTKLPYNMSDYIFKHATNVNIQTLQDMKCRHSKKFRYLAFVVNMANTSLSFIFKKKEKKTNFLFSEHVISENYYNQYLWMHMMEHYIFHTILCIPLLLGEVMLWNTIKRMVKCFIHLN